MDNSILFSIVVPAYNAEECLAECLDSVLSQTYSPFEVIVVNDGSVDGTLEICKRFTETNSCVSVIDKPNGGLSSARNAGSAVASGDYILYLDADDVLVSDALKELSSFLLFNKVDILTFGFKEVDSATNRLKREWTPPVTDMPVVNGTAFVDFLDTGALENYAWSRVYSVSFLRRLEYMFSETVSFLEDIEFTYRACLTADSFGFLNKPLYVYKRQKGSMCTSVSLRRAIDGFHVVKTAFESRGHLMNDRALNGTLGTLFMCYDLANDPADPNAQVISQEIYSYACNISNHVNNLNGINKAKLMLIRLHLYSLARRFISFIR